MYLPSGVQEGLLCFAFQRCGTNLEESDFITYHTLHSSLFIIHFNNIDHLH